MFKQTLAPNIRVCATCEFWDGERNTDFMQMSVYVDMMNASGVCRNFSAPFRGVMTKSNQSCQYWNKWRVLR